MKSVDPFDGSLLDFAFPRGRAVDVRLGDLHVWLESRRNAGVWPFSRIAFSKPSHTATVGNERGEGSREYINFGSQDYLGLAQHPDVHSAAIRAIDAFGVHSAGSAIVTGRTALFEKVERRIADILGKECVTIYPTGWGAGFGVLQGLVRFYDSVLIDELAHSCLREGALHATRRVKTVRHNDLQHVKELLSEEREQDAERAIVVVVESLYSMDSDCPSLKEIMHLAERYDATVIVDVAHDFGCLGADGLGVLSAVDRSSDRLVIMGSFSKTFASNGGFVASNRVVKDHLTVFSAPYTFSNALSPVQTAVVDQSIAIAFSPTGGKLRATLLGNIEALREAMSERGMIVRGVPSPIVPVFVGDEAVARATAMFLVEGGLLANLAEYPGVPRGAARFRFQVMATHEKWAIAEAARIMQASKRRACELIEQRS